MAATSQTERERLLAGIKAMSHADMAYTLALLEELELRKRIAMCQTDFLAFIAAVDPQYKFGSHLKRLGNLLMQVEAGHKDRIAVSMAPRFGKSTMISIYYPAWYLGKHPDHKMIVASHTSDLAVDMARKVRNLMQSDEYKRIFPGVTIAADAKAAGKWNTTRGGEVYAVGVGGSIAGRGADLCVDPATPVKTRERGVVPAGSVQIGEHLRSWHGWTRVRAKIHSTHSATVTVANRLQVSATHPIWTYTRGWVAASDLQPDDVLWMTSVWDKLVSFLQGDQYANHEAWAVPGPGVQHLGDDAAAVHQPQRGQLRQLWSAWHHGVRSVANFCRFLRRYGRSAVSQAYVGSDRSGGALYAAELPLGGRRDPAEQPFQWRADHRVRSDAVSTAVGAAYRAVDRHDPASSVHDGDASGASVGRSAHESQQAQGTPVPAGWFRRAVLRFLGRCSQSDGSGQPRTGAQGYLARLGRQWAGVLWVLLGVRRAGDIRIDYHRPRNFVNFTVDGDNTFVANSVLTHNCIVDDPLSEQDIRAGNTDALDSVYEYFRAGLRTRLMPGGRICILHTRWHQRDLIGRLVKDGALNPDGDVYEVFEFPAILTVPNPDTDPEAPKTIEKSLWPEQWSLESLLRTKASMPSWQWNAQYQQSPTAQEAVIIKRDDIQWWPHERPPQIEFTVQSFDTAMTTKERSDYSVCQTWGVWKDENDLDNVILLNCARGKWEFPELKRVAHEQFKEWEPDALIVETKASGQPLVDELRRSGIIVQEFSPGKGQDKIARVNAISDMFASRQVWFPETWWASEVVEELLAFPAGEHDDCVDALTLALIRIRKGGLLRLANDVTDEPRLTLPRRTVYY